MATALALRLRKSGHLPVVAASACTLALLLLGSLYSRNFLSADYLLLQLQIASFLGVVATGAMLVILLGGIDLSVPWVVTVGGVMSASAAGWWGPAGEWLAIPFGIACGAVLGLVTWAVGYLGWLPATGLMPPVTQQEPARVAGPVATHLGYGIATAAAYQWLRRRVDR